MRWATSRLAPFSQKIRYSSRAERMVRIVDRPRSFSRRLTIIQAATQSIARLVSFRILPSTAASDTEPG